MKKLALQLGLKSRDGPTGSMFAWTVQKVNSGGGSAGVVTGGAPDYDFAKTGPADGWDNATFSTETLAGDCDVSFVWNDSVAAANLTIGFDEAAPVQGDLDFSNNVLHGLYCQTGLAFRHVDRATPFDTLMSGIQIGDTVTIRRRGGVVDAITTPARAGSPLTIKTGAAVNPYRIVFSIGRVGYSLGDVGFGPL